MTDSEFADKIIEMIAIFAWDHKGMFATDTACKRFIELMMKLSVTEVKEI